MVKYGDNVQVYMDNILITTEDDLEFHRKVVKAVLKVLKDELFFLRSAKCNLEKEQVQYLGMILNKGIIKPDLSKLAGLQDWPRTLFTITDVRKTLGVLNYH